jgi:SAM-dependent methyltransferase
VEIGSIFLSEAGAQDASIVEADFTSDEFARSVSPPADLAFAVESFLHVPRICERFGSVARLVKPGGKLIVCDDMISRECTAESLRDTVSAPRVRRWFREFRDGWHAAGLAEIDAVISGAAEAGLRLDEIRDLTPYLELDRRRDLVARVLMGLLRWSPVRPPWFANLLGGNALQLCLKNGLIRYMCAVFTRVR